MSCKHPVNCAECPHSCFFGLMTNFPPFVYDAGEPCAVAIPSRVYEDLLSDARVSVPHVHYAGPWTRWKRASRRAALSQPASTPWWKCGAMSGQWKCGATADSGDFASQSAALLIQEGYSMEQIIALALTLYYPAPHRHRVLPSSEKTRLLSPCSTCKMSIH